MLAASRARPDPEFGHPWSDAMNTHHARLQPQDPFAAKLGVYVVRVGVVMTLVGVVASFFRS
jgi:hypothetical protein